MRNNYLNAGGASSSSASSSGGSGLSNYATLISTALDFGVSFITAKGIKKDNEAFLRRMANLENEQAEKLKKLINQSATEVAKTRVIFEFLAEEDRKKLEAETKKAKILPLIGLGIGVILLGIVFYKLNEQNG
jgi:hypothetical protein